MDFAMHAIKQDFNRLKSLSLESYMLLGYLLMVGFLTVARFILHRVGIGYGFERTAILTCIAIVPFVLACVLCRKQVVKRCKMFFVVYLGVLGVIALSYYLVPELQFFIERNKFGIERVLRPDSALYALFFFLLVEDMDELLFDVRVYAYAYMVYLVGAELVPAILAGGWMDDAPNGGLMKFSYSLNFGYSMLIPTLLLFQSFLQRKSYLDLVIVLGGFWAIVTNGNRGSFVLVGGFAYLYALTKIVKMTSFKFRVLWVVLFGISALVFLVFREPVVFVATYFLASWMDEKDIAKLKKKVLYLAVFVCAWIVIIDTLLPFALHSLAPNLDLDASRTEEMLKSGEFAENNGRIAIWSAVIEGIKTGPVWGHGFFGDRPFVYALHVIAYSHNIFLELVCSFGIFGVLGICYILYDVLTMVFCCKDEKYQGLYLVYLVVSCQLLLSLSFWYVYAFWAAVALAYRYRAQYPNQTLWSIIKNLLTSSVK